MLFIHQVQLLVTIGFVCFFLFDNTTKLWVLQNEWLWDVSLLSLFLTMFILSNSKKARRNFPENFVVLGIFTLAMSFTLGMTSAGFETPDVLLALVVILRSTYVYVDKCEVALINPYTLNSDDHRRYVHVDEFSFNIRFHSL